MKTPPCWSDLAFDFSGASVLVTGGTAGIGAGLAAAFREAGADVTITGTRPTAECYDEGLGAFRYRQLRLEDPDHIIALASGLGRLDILVNNGGAGSLLEEFVPDVFDQTVQVMLNGVYRLSSACLGLLEKSKRPGGGSIVNLSSSSSFLSVDAAPAYSAAKAGVNGLTRTLAMAWGGKNIRVNAIAPGLTRTRMTEEAFRSGEYTGPACARTPAGRLASPDDMAGPVLFLSSSAASFVTGQILPVDGGFTVSG